MSYKAVRREVLSTQGISIIGKCGEFVDKTLPWDPGPAPGTRSILYGRAAGESGPVLDFRLVLMMQFVHYLQYVSW